MLEKKDIQFIQEHLSEDVTQLAFQKNKFAEFDLPKLLFQIQARQKLTQKLPTWIKHSSLFFPPQISLEQASSETTALFKSKLITGKIVDLTGGMGLDSWAFAQEANNQVSYIEINEPLHQITKYNHQVLGLEQIKHFHADGMEYIKNHVSDFDWIYMDPARRDSKGKKMFLLKDCTPDATQILPLISNKTGLLLKVSPMLDIELCIKELQGVQEVHIVCIQNEIKELLFLKTTQSTLNPLISVWDLHLENPLLIQQTKKDETESIPNFSPVSQYLYEPHAGLLKAGFYKSIQGEGLTKIAPNTHLYTSDTLQTNFPGKKYQVKSIGKLDKNWIKSQLDPFKASISCRNFPIKPEEIRKKLRISDGGDMTLFAFKDFNNKSEIAICKKLNP